MNKMSKKLLISLLISGLAGALLAQNAFADEKVISVGDVWRYFKGTSAPPANWHSLAFDDSGWLQGQTGIGYGDLTYPTTLTDMGGSYLTFYARHVFNVDDPTSISALKLYMCYDDGFIAYLNGQEVARSNSMGSAGTAFAYNSVANFSHDEEDPEEIFTINTLGTSLLQAGNNVLAIEVHNVDMDSSDAALVPGLVAITNLAPIAKCSADYPKTGVLPLSVNFNASASQDPDGSIINYSWDFGDGSSAVNGVNPQITHVYNSAGVYAAVLTVTDDDNSTTTKTVNILAGPAKTYYVAEPKGADGISGTSDDVNASDSYPGTLTQPFATLKKAADLASGGDTVIIRGGFYNQTLWPQNSGADGLYITFKNYNGETPVITEASLEPAINISDREYIIIDGLKVDYVDRWLYAVRTQHSIIQNSIFCRALSPGGSSKAGLFFQEANFNKVLNNTLDQITSDGLALHKSERNLIEGNTMTNAGHTLWTVKGGNFNIFRNNYFHNPLQKIGEVYDMDGAGFDHELYGNDCTKYNLIENNKFDYTPSSGDHSPFAGIQYAGQKGIIRKNSFYDTVGPALDLTLYGAEATFNYGNRVYNNVFFKTDFAGISLAGSGAYTFYDNIMKNNILAKSIFVANDTRWSWYTTVLNGKPVQLMTGRLDGFVFDHNNLFNQQSSGELFLISYGTRTSGSNPPPQPVSWWRLNYPQLFKDNLELEPLFIDETKFDFHLTQNSPMIDAGAFLTKTVGSGNSASLKVEDAGYFYDGYDIEGEQGDLIQLEGQAQTARILDIDYQNNILILDRPLSWAAGQGVSLSYSGSAPDLGAYEYDLQGAILYGDVSGNGEISAYDAALAAMYAVGLIDLQVTQIQAADVSGNGEVSAYDAALIAQRAVGLINRFPIE